MRLRTIFLLPALCLFITGCQKKSEDDPIFFPQQINEVVIALKASFDSAHAVINPVIDQFSVSGVDSAEMRQALQYLYGESTLAREFVFITPEGIIQLIEPEMYQIYEGSDVSQQEHIIQSFQSGEPVLSNTLMVAEGYYAAVDMHPIMQSGQVLGAINMVFEPAALLKRIIEPITAGQDFEIWVMETTGLVLYDEDEEEIGLNVLTDPLYQDFPDLLAAAQKIAADHNGETTYSFFQAGTSTTVTKMAYWDSFSLHGNQWRVVWVIPVD